MVNDYKFECSFCGSKFKLEDRFMNHRCKEMIRDEEIRTPTGQAAWSFYQTWLKKQRRAVPRLETFLTSRYYATFIKFAKFAKKVGIPDTDMFIKYMIDRDIPPTIWMNNEIYASFIEFLDRSADPNKQAAMTIDYMFKIADALDCDVSDIFEYLHPDDIIQMLHRRQLSPWILLHSPKFKQFLIHKTTDQQKIAMQAIIRPDYWAEKKTQRPEVVAVMKKYVRELNL